ncbi:MAG: glyoxylate/hydroxypyruvate reductase A [Betaproteobacteria bacterium]|nr:glyoxylate/hydroxypyruvate reductase A [Betaproteobacteria bacterium]
MNISFCCKDDNASLWIGELQTALPQASVTLWQPGAPQADMAVVWAPPQQFFDEQPQLRAIFNVGAGVDALMKLRLPAQALVVRLDDAGMAVQMAEYVCHAVVRHMRHFAAYEADAQTGRWQRQLAPDRSAFPVGVMGLGVLGERVWSRTPKGLSALDCYAGLAALPHFLARCRVLVCLLPLTPDTQGILNRETLGQLKRGAYLINVARGGHLVEDDLLPLLASGQLAGATLDVFRTEPLPPEHPFWRHPQIRVTPHISAGTLPGKSIAQIVDKIGALTRGEPITGIVDRQRGY